MCDKSQERMARATLKALGISLSHDHDADEYRVNYRNGKEATAYYTNDLEDAVGTGRAMAQWLADTEL